MDFITVAQDLLQTARRRDDTIADKTAAQGFSDQAQAVYKWARCLPRSVVGDFIRVVLQKGPQEWQAHLDGLLLRKTGHFKEGKRARRKTLELSEKLGTWLGGSTAYDIASLRAIIDQKCREAFLQSQPSDREEEDV